MDPQSFLANKLKEKGLTLKKLSELSGVALKHLENLNSGNFERLPPTPYLRGYLKKIGEILNFDGENMLKDLEREKLVTSSGPEDTLPKNRFSKKTHPGRVWGVVAIILVITFLSLRFSAIIGRPKLEVSHPSSEEIFVTSLKEISIRGNLRGGNKVSINGEEVIISEDGNWSKTIPLERGLNTIEITAKKFLGQEVSLLRQVLYESQEDNPLLPENQESSPSESTSTEEIPI